jgi:hypothetical protein
MINDGLFNAAREKIQEDIFPLHRITAFKLLDSIKEAQLAQKELTKQLSITHQRKASFKEAEKQRMESQKRVQAREKLIGSLKESSAAAWEAFQQDLIGPAEKPSLTHNPFQGLEMAIEASETPVEPQEPSPSTLALPEPKEAIQGLLAAIEAVGQLQEVLDLVGANSLDRPLDKELLEELTIAVELVADQQ